MIGVLSNSGLGFTFTNVLVQLGSGSLMALLLLAAAVCIVLGMGLPTVGVYVLLAALVAPGLVEVGVHPMAAHLYVMYFGMLSMLTPPVAIAAYAAAGVANADPVRTGFASVRFGWLAYVIPFLFVLSPTLILVGSTLKIMAAIAAAAIGIWLVSIAITGFLTRRIGPLPRAVFLVTGLLALAPQGAFTGAYYLALIGVLAGLAAAGYELLIIRARQRRGAA
ncbi:MAG: TRAP transporter large permease subunit [Alphaproteobacteria bacterium]